MTTSKSAAVLLVSDEPNDTDVLLVSFELEQMLREIPAGQHAPKVTHTLWALDEVAGWLTDIRQPECYQTKVPRSGRPRRCRATVEVAPIAG